MKFPSTEKEWLEISNQIFEHWQFPNSLGAMDGKHIAIVNPPGSGSTYYNYKGFFSVVLLALVKHNYQFIYVNVGCQGRISDGGVFKATDLYEGLTSSTLNIPKPRTLPKTGDPCWDEDHYPEVPFVIVGDDAFQLSTFMMKPYSNRTTEEDRRIFNYRLSRFRRVSENAFGILAARFRVFLTKIHLSPRKASKVTLAACYLHNMLCEKSKGSYMPSNFIDSEDPITGEVIEGRWRNDVPRPLTGDEVPTGCRAQTIAESMRLHFKEYFNGPGALPWQEKVLL